MATEEDEGLLELTDQQAPRADCRCWFGRRPCLKRWRESRLLSVAAGIITWLLVIVNGVIQNCCDASPLARPQISALKPSTLALSKSPGRSTSGIARASRSPYASERARKITPSERRCRADISTASRRTLAKRICTVVFVAPLNENYCGLHQRRIKMPQSCANVRWKASVRFGGVVFVPVDGIWSRLISYSMRTRLLVPDNGQWSRWIRRLDWNYLWCV